MNGEFSIGVMDTGIGGLTVVREMVRLYPEEDLLYFGDSANCPYGNCSREEIVKQSRRILRFFEKRQVKVVAIACNTISAVLEQLTQDASLKLIGIVAPAAEAVARSGITRVGIYATEFTVLCQTYDRLIHACNPDIEVLSRGSRSLAALIDRNETSDEVIDGVIRADLTSLLLEQEPQQIVLGCTHFPIVMENFHRCFPQTDFIDPAREQARAVGAFLAQHGLRSTKKQGRLDLNTSGDPEILAHFARRLGLSEAASCQRTQL